MSYKEKRELELKKEAEEKAAKAAAEVSYSSGEIVSYLGWSGDPRIYNEYFFGWSPGFSLKHL